MGHSINFTVSTEDSSLVSEAVLERIEKEFGARYKLKDNIYLFTTYGSFYVVDLLEDLPKLTDKVIILNQGDLEWRNGPAGENLQTSVFKTDPVAGKWLFNDQFWADKEGKRTT